MRAESHLPYLKQCRIPTNEKGQLLEEILAKLEVLPEKEREEVIEMASAATSNMKWIPNPGPQTEAYFSEADELYYGGQVGGGKSDLILGLAENVHEKSLIMRKYLDDARSLADRFIEIHGDVKGWNGQLLKFKDGSKTIDFGGCQHEKDKQRYKGKPHDLIGFDEIPDFPYSVFSFIKTWNRSATGQRCRIVCAGNPPTEPEGLWVIEYWAPWLDPEHPNPAKPGELRWFITDGNDLSVEVAGPGEYELDGEILIARSRTFIRSTLNDNPDLADTDYDAILSGLPADLRSAYRDGEFKTILRDNPRQVIPAAWVKAAQDRWTDQPPAGVPMCAIGVDVAEGGDDNNVLASRYDAWYAPLVKIPGKETPLGTDLLGPIMQVRRNDAKIVLDVGGGYGGTTYAKLKENNIPVTAHKGSKASMAKSRDGMYEFANKRAEDHWRFREALDPDQPGGSRVALPPDSRLFSDLCSTLYSVKRMTVHLETKEDLVKRLGRSPDDGDAVINAWSDGDKIENSYQQWQANKTAKRPKTVMGRQAARRK